MRDITHFLLATLLSLATMQEAEEIGDELIQIIRDMCK